MNELLLLGTEGNIIDRIRSIQKALEDAQKDVIVPGVISELTPNLGIMTAGELRSYADPTDPSAPGDGFSGVRILGIGADYGGSLYAILGAVNDSLTFGIRLSDGLGVWGGGNATMGPEGINLTGLTTIIRAVAEFGGNTRTGRLMMTVPDGETIPVWAMDLTSVGGGELLANPGFETGDFTNWTKTTETNGAWVIDSVMKYAGSYSTYFGCGGGVPAGVLTSDRVGVTALSNYLFSGYSRATSDTLTVKAEVKWYDHAGAGNLLRTDLIGSGVGGGWLYWDKTFEAPATALSCAMVFTVGGAANPGRFVWYDAFSITLITIAQRLWLSDDGVQCTNGVYPTRMSRFSDEFLANGATTDHFYDGLQRYGTGTFVTARADADWFTTSFMLQKGTYTLKILGITSNAGGKVDTYLDDVLIVSADDWYSAGTVYNVIKSHAAIAVTYDGYHKLKFLVNGKNGASSNFYFITTKAWMYQATD